MLLKVKRVRHNSFLRDLLFFYNIFLSFTLFMVGVDGFEPSRCCHQWFLRPPCLPIPAHARTIQIIIFYFFSIKLNFKSVNKIINIIVYKHIGAYGLVQQNNIINNKNFISEFKNLENLKFNVSIIKNKHGIVIRTS